jgi:hypothetical protein
MQGSSPIEFISNAIAFIVDHGLLLTLNLLSAADGATKFTCAINIIIKRLSVLI